MSSYFRLGWVRSLFVRLGQGINYHLSNHSSLFFLYLSVIAGPLRKILLKPPGGSFICPTRYGFRLIIDVSSSEVVSKNVFLKGSYEAGTLEVMRNCLRPGDIFIDVGSHIGLMALAASKCVGNKGRVFAFEPNPKTFEILKMNIEINRISNIKAFNIALGTTAGRSVLYSPTTQSGKASLIKDPQEDAPATEVTIDTLDDFIRREELEVNKIRMIKIDVEGWEKAVLEGSKRILSSSSAPILCVEYSTLHPALGPTEDLYYFVVAQTPLKIYKLEKGKERLAKLLQVLSAKDLPRHDNLFCFRDDDLGTVPQKMFQQAGK